MMKRYLSVALAAMLALATAIPVAASPFADVPENHWAYEAVKQLAAYGIVEGFPDGTFKGSQPTTRYQMAMVVARLLVSLDAQIKSAIEAAKAQLAPGERVVEKETITVEKPIVEKVVETQVVEKPKSEELDALAAKVAEIEAAIAALRGQVDEVDAKTAEIDEALPAAEKAHAEELAALAAKVAEIEKALDTLSGLVGEVDQKAAGIDARVAKLESAPPVVEKETVVVEKPVIEKVVETQIVEKLKTEELDALAARLAALEGAVGEVGTRVDEVGAKGAELDGALALLEGDFGARILELEAAAAAGDADLADQIEALRADIEAKLADSDSALNQKIEAKAKELIGLIDALKTEFSKELTVLGVRVAALEDQLAIANTRIDDLEARLAASHEELAGSIASLREDLESRLASVNTDLQAKIAAGDTEAANKLAGVKTQLEGQIAALDAKAGAIGTKLDEYIAGHEKVAITGTSEVVLEDVDIYANFTDVYEGTGPGAWIDPNDIFDDEVEDIHSDGEYEPTTTFQHELDLTLTARPADGVAVTVGLSTIKDLFGGTDVPEFKLGNLSLEVKTPGTLTRVFAGGVTLPEGTFTPFTLTGDQLLNDDDEPIYQGVIAQGAYGKFSGTTMFWKVEPEQTEEEPADLYPDYVAAGEAKFALTDNVNLSAAYVSKFDDPQSTEIDDGTLTGFAKDTVISVGGTLALAPGWTASGEFAKNTKYVDGVAQDPATGDVEEPKGGTAARIDVAGKVGSISLAGNFTRIEGGFAPNLVNLDPDNGGIEADVKSVSVDATLPIGSLTITGGYEITGDADPVADWDTRKVNIADAGVSYKMAWGAMEVTPAVGVKSSAYVLADDSLAYDNDNTVFEVTGGVDAKLGPFTGSYDATTATLKVGAGVADPYYSKSVLDVGLDYAVLPTLKLTGGYTLTRVDEKKVVEKVFPTETVDDDIDEEYTSVVKAGLAGEFPLSAGTKVTGSYDYEVKTDLIDNYNPYTKGILKTGLTSQLTPKASLAASAEFDKLTRLEGPGDDYEYSPLANLITTVDYTYNITTNTALTLGYKVVKSDRARDEGDTGYDYTARVITGSLKVTF